MSIYYLKPTLDEVQLPLLNRTQYISLNLRPNERVSAEVVDVLPSGAAILRIKGNEIEVKTQIPLQKDMQLELKVSALNENKKDINLQILDIKTPLQKEIQKRLLKNPDIKELLILSKADKNLVKEFVKENIQSLTQNILFFQNSKSLNLSLTKESLEPFFLDMQDFKVDIKEFIKQGSGISVLKGLIDIDKKIDDMALKYGLKREDIIAALKKEDLSLEVLELKQEIEDLKKEYALLQKQESVFDYSRLISFLSGSLFVPFFWEFAKGAIAIKSLKNETFLCKIELEFEDIGRLDIDILACNKDLLVDVYSLNEDFLETLKEGFEEIKDSLDFDYVFFRFHKSSKEGLKEIFKDSLVDKKV